MKRNIAWRDEIHAMFFYRYVFGVVRSYFKDSNAGCTNQYSGFPVPDIPMNLWKQKSCSPVGSTISWVSSSWHRRNFPYWFVQPANYVVGWDLEWKLKYIFYEIKRGIYRYLCGKEIYCYSGCYIGCIRSEHWSVFLQMIGPNLKIIGWS